jgi:TetR/AcrR family transcriptional regulator, regulator of cefoperazone and chloramphenicol sensitivity
LSGGALSGGALSGGGAGGKRPLAIPAQDHGRDSASRQRLIDAAVECILDQGFYRASSNAIAERAGVTWGVIQYHFGNREALMLAVLEDGARRLTDTLRNAEIADGTVTERVAQYMDILAGHYASPTYLAFTQVLLNLTHDPRTTRQTRETMNSIAETATPELRRLQRQVLAGTGAHSPAMRAVLLHALRGLALSHVMLDTLPGEHDDAQHFGEQRVLLAEALGLLIEHQAEPQAGAARGIEGIA